MDSLNFLVDWTARYLKNKDIMLKRIAELEVRDNSVLVKNKNGSVSVYIASLSLENIDANIKSAVAAYHTGASGGAAKAGITDVEICIVVLNSKENISFLVKKWAWFVSISNLSVLFVNPFSDADEKWVVKPAIHARVCNERNLAKSFASLSENIPNISEEQFKEKVKEML